jgi:hypothetical protein
MNTAVNIYVTITNPVPFGPIAVLVTNCFRLEQKSYLPLQLCRVLEKQQLLTV